MPHILECLSSAHVPCCTSYILQILGTVLQRTAPTPHASSEAEGAHPDGCGDDSPMEDAVLWEPCVSAHQESVLWSIRYSVDSR